MEDNTLKSGQRTAYRGWGVQFTNETIELEGTEGIMEYLESSEEDNGYNNDYTCGGDNNVYECECDDKTNCEGISNEECNVDGWDAYEWYHGCCGCYLIDNIEHMNESSYDNYDNYVDINRNNGRIDRNMSIDDLLESKRKRR